MTENNRNERATLNRLSDALVEDLLNTSDEEILNDFRASGGDLNILAKEMKGILDKSIISANKSRLAAARSGANSLRYQHSQASIPIDMASARARLKAIINAPETAQQLTLAARKENELSDADILGMLEDLQELGSLPPDNKNGGKS